MTTIDKKQQQQMKDVKNIMQNAKNKDTICTVNTFKVKLKPLFNIKKSKINYTNNNVFSINNLLNRSVYLTEK